MLLQALASGSNGNSFVINSGNLTVLIDVGISRRRIIEGLSRLNIDRSSVKYILITHAHSDHIIGLPVLHLVLNFRIIATEGTIEEIRKLVRIDSRYGEIADNAILIENNKNLPLEGVEVIGYETIHDIQGSTGFTLYFYDEDLTVSYTTDTADVTTGFKQAMRMSDFILIEANHDHELLKKSRRPIWLKERIKNTHLSNKSTVKILESVVSKQTKVLFLGHLSGECNTPNVVGQLISSFKSYCVDKLPSKSSWMWIICTREESSTLVEYNNSLLLDGGLSELTYVRSEEETEKIGIREYLTQKGVVKRVKKKKLKNFDSFFKSE